MQTLPGNGSPTAPSSTKRRASRKAASTTDSRPVEVLFKEQPNPYHKPQPPFIWIDHPQQNERLRGPVYVIRLGVGGADSVEIAIDQAPWQKCRQTSGYWWFDWSAIAPGKHTLVARMKTADSRWYKTPPRTCDYKAG
jgi:hypothetical protein